MSRLGWWLPALLVATPLGAQHPGPRDWRAFDRYVAEAVRDWNAPGLAIAVVAGDSVVFAHGYGVRALGTHDSVDTHTLFANASTTKAFTSMVLAMLVDDGRMSFDDPVIRWLPGYRLADPWVTRELRVRDLVTHRVGFGDPLFLWYGRDAGWDTIAHRLAFVEPETSFRSHFAYNNVSYATAGVIAGVVAGEPWDALVHTRILAPLGMNETVTRGSDLPMNGNVAEPHDIINDTLQRIEPPQLVDPIPSAGAMYSSVSDMAKWLRFLLDSAQVGPRRLVSAASFTELFRPQMIIGEDEFYPTALRTHPHVTAYGMGWFLQDYRGQWVVFHTGSIDGYVAIVGMMPDLGVGVVAFANRDHVEVRHALMLRVFDMFLDGPPHDWSSDLRGMYDSLAAASAERRAARDSARVVGTNPSHALDAYVGAYADSAFGVGRVRMEDGHLVWAVSAYLTGTLEHWQYDTFRIHWRRPWLGTNVVTFLTGADGQITGARTMGYNLDRVEN